MSRYPSRLSRRGFLAKAKKTAEEGQEPAAFVQSRGGKALVVMEADALESLLGILAHKEGRE